MSCHSAISYFPVRTRKYDGYAEDRIQILPYTGSGNWSWELTVETEQQLAKKAWRNIFFFLCKLSLVLNG